MGDLHLSGQNRNLLIKVKSKKQRNRRRKTGMAKRAAERAVFASLRVREISMSAAEAV
jgi:hypothetical protein